MVAALSSQAQEAPLLTLANETGGAYFGNNNDLHAGLVHFYERDSYNYILTYATPSAAAGGRYHKIKLEVTRPGLKLNYRKGYFAPQEEVSYERRVREDILEGLQAPGNLNEIPLHLSYNYSQLDDSKYQLALLAEIDLRKVKFQEEESRHKNQIHLILVALDEQDRYVDGVQKSMEFNLSDTSFDNLRKSDQKSKWEVIVPPGHYKIRAVVREGLRTRMGSATEIVVVP